MMRILILPSAFILHKNNPAFYVKSNKNKESGRNGT